MNKLQEACIISHEHWLNELEQTLALIDIEIPEIEIPKKKKDKQPKNKKNRTVKGKIIKILIIAAIIASLLITVSAYKPFREFVVEFFEDHNLLTTDILDTHYPKNIDVSYIPEGFVLVEENNGDISALKKYECGEKTFVVLKNTPNTSHQISNTYTKTDVFYNGNIKYSLFELANNSIEIVWLTDEYLYVLFGHNVSNEELIEIAKGIK